MAAVGAAGLCRFVPYRVPRSPEVAAIDYFTGWYELKIHLSHPRKETLTSSGELCGAFCL